MGRTQGSIRDPAGGAREPAVVTSATERIGGDGTVVLPAPVPASLRLRSEAGSERGRGWLLHRALLVADVFGLGLAFFLAQLLFEPAGNTRDVVSPGLESLIFALSLPLWIVIAQLSGLYGRDGQRADHSTVDDIVPVLAVITTGAWIFFAVVGLTETVRLNPQRMVAFWLMAIAFVLSARAVARAAARRSPKFRQNVVIVGAGDVGQLIARKLQQHPEYAIDLVGFVDVQPKERREDLADLTLLGSTEGLPELVERFDIDRVIIAYSNDTHEHVLELIHMLKASSIQIDLVPRLFEAVGPRVDVHTVEGLPLLGLPPVRLSPSARIVKRSIDLILAGIGLLLTAPLFAYIAWRIKRDSPGPVFFRQTRLGLLENEFRVFKFRTMQVGVDDAEHRAYIKATMSSRAPAGDNGLYKLEREDDTTAVGRWLRETSLDELPQLINVIKGEMSLVGPRPCIPYETEHFAPHHFERFLVPAGLTGLWQVTARAHSSFGEALDMDVAYARGWSLGLDLRLLCRTPVALFRQKATTR